MRTASSLATVVTPFLPQYFPSPSATSSPTDATDLAACPATLAPPHRSLPIPFKRKPMPNKASFCSGLTLELIRLSVPMLKGAEHPPQTPEV